MKYIEVGENKYLIVYRDWTNTKQGKIPDVAWCPFCDGSHSHGIEDGHRYPNCTYNHKEYIITDDGTKLFKRDGYYIVDINKPT